VKRIATLFAVAAVLCVAAAPARANLVFEVNNAGDRPDSDPNGICDGAPNLDGDQCSLRGAIQEANAIPGSDGIRFAIPGRGVHRITPDSLLPAITGPVEIDGYTQPGAAPNSADLNHPDNAVLQVELSGVDVPGPPTGSSSGLLMRPTAAGSLIRGLVVNAFPLFQLDLRGSAVVQGNFIGTNASGTAAPNPDEYGINAEPVATSTARHLIGGPTAAARNVISGNTDTGIDGSTMRVQGNFIGTQADGVSPLGNGNIGVNIWENSDVGGPGSAANVIAHSPEGITLVSTADSGNTLSRNRIFGIADLGIDLAYDGSGITPNDQLDADNGPNDLQNFPLLVKAVTRTKGTAIQGALASVPNESFTIEYFAGPQGSGREGRRFIGRQTVSSDADGFSNFTFRPTARVPVGQAVTATATNSNGSTSEFSAPRVVTAP
jgi:hypothetical protein